MAIQTKIQITGDTSNFDNAARNVKRQMVQITDATKKFGQTVKGATRLDGIADMQTLFDKLSKNADTAGGKIQMLSSLAASFGGPWGIAIAAVTAAIVALADKFDWFNDKVKADAQAAAQSAADAYTKILFGGEAAALAEDKKKIEAQITADAKRQIELQQKLGDVQEKRMQQLKEGRMGYVKMYDQQIASLTAEIDGIKLVNEARAEGIKQREKELALKMKGDKVEDKTKERTPTNNREKKLSGSQWEKVNLAPLEPVLQRVESGPTVNDLLSIDTTTLSTLGQMSAYLQLTSKALQDVEIGSEAYNKLGEAIKSVTDRQQELNGTLKAGTDSAEDQQKSLQAISSVFGSASDSLDSFAESSNVAAVAQKSLAVAEQAAALAAAIHSAATGGDPYTVAARIAAAAAAVVASLASMAKFSNGGIVQGNHSGDGVVARLNGGEMVLNSQQQSNLFRQLNSNASGNGQQTVNFVLEADRLIGSMNNRNKSVNRLK